MRLRRVQKRDTFSHEQQEVHFTLVYLIRITFTYTYISELFAAIFTFFVSSCHAVSNIFTKQRIYREFAEGSNKPGYLLHPVRGIEIFLVSSNSFVRRVLETRINFHSQRAIWDVGSVLLGSLGTLYAEHEKVDIKKEMIKHAIEYLIGDGLVTCFASSLLLNNRLDRICRELDSLGFEQNFLRNASVWNFINEKSYWQAYESATLPEGTGVATSVNDDSDLDVEVGSIKEENSTCRRGCYGSTIVHSVSCNEETDFTDPPAYRTHEPDTYEVPEVTSLIAKNDQAVREKEINQVKKSELRKERRGLNNDIKQRETDWRSSRLKIVICKRCSIDRRSSVVSRPLKVTRLPLPCKPNYLMVQLYRAVPCLSETCLIIMKRKFENRIYNVCSYLNNILRELSGEIIKELRLRCEICAGHIEFELRSGLGGNLGGCVFIDRVPIYRGTCRNNASRRASTSISKSAPRQAELERSKDFHVQFRDTATGSPYTYDKPGAHKISFYSPCSDDNVADNERVIAHEQKEIEFILSPTLTRATRSRYSVAPPVSKAEQRIPQVAGINANEVAQSSNDQSEGPQVARVESPTLSSQSVEKNVQASRHKDAPKVEYSANSAELRNGSCASLPGKGSENVVTRCECTSGTIEVMEINRRWDRSPVDSRICFPRKNANDEMESCEGDSLEKSSWPRGLNKEERAYRGNSARSSSADTSVTIEVCDIEVKCTSSFTDTEIERDSLCSCFRVDHTGRTSKKDVQVEVKDAHSFNVVEEFVTSECAKEPLNEGPLLGPRNFLSVSVQTSKTEMASKAVSIDDQLITTPDHLIMTFESKSDDISCSSHANSNRVSIDRTKTEYTFVTDIFNKLQDDLNIGNVANEEQLLSPITPSDEESNIAQLSCRINAASVSRCCDAPSEVSFRVKSHELRMTSKTFRPREPSAASSSVRTKLPGNRGGKLRNPMHFTVRLSSQSFGNLSGADPTAGYESKSRKCKGVRRAFAQFKHRISSSGGVFKDPRNPFSRESINRIRYMIRRKLNGVLFRTRDRGTNTSRTLLKSKSKRCTCCTDARVRGRRGSIESRDTFLTQFRESSGRALDVCNEICTERSCRMFGGTDVVNNIRLVEASNFVGFYEPSYQRKSHTEKEYTNDKNLRENTNRKLYAHLFSNYNKEPETDQRSAEELFPRRCNTCDRQTKRENVGTGKIMPQKKIHRSAEERFHGHCIFCNESEHDLSNVYSRDSLVEARCNSSSSHISAVEIRNETMQFRGTYVRHSGSLENTHNLSRRNITSRRASTEELLEGNNDRARTAGGYESRVNDLAAEFRLKLSQYVALCKSAKDSLIKRLRTESIYKVDVSSAMHREK